MIQAKINYNEIFKKEINDISKLKTKPTLFLHACCGPCLTYPLSVLIKYFKVTIGFFNPNIYPEEEYFKRFNELKRFVKEYTNNEVNIILNEYNYQTYLDQIKGYEKEKEGGKRCEICHRLRLELSYKYAYDHHFDYFTSVMTVSCKKPSSLLNEIGIDLEKKYLPTKYLQADFKKENGQLKGIQIAKEYNLYRQNYCGCSFSLEARKEFEKLKMQILNKNS